MTLKKDFESVFLPVEEKPQKEHEVIEYDEEKPVNEADAEFVRANLINLSKKASVLADTALDRIEDGNSSARDIEVASGALKAAADIAGKILDVQKASTPQVHTQILNSGGTVNTVTMSSSELLKELLKND